MSIFPPLVLRRHQNVWVVRDDKFPYGSKARFLYWYFRSLSEKGIREVVYGSSPRWGYAQISVAWLACHFGIKFTLFIAASKELHPCSKMAVDLGAKVMQVPMGFLAVTEKRARDYANKNGRLLLPMGLDIPEAIAGIKRWASRLDVRPDEVWTVAGSGTLTRGLQAAWPEADHCTVQVGHKLTESEAGKARVLVYPRGFGSRAKILPPFPSVSEYDAKAWEFIPKDGKGLRLFWNVGRNPT